MKERDRVSASIDPYLRAKESKIYVVVKEMSFPTLYHDCRCVCNLSRFSCSFLLHVAESD